MMTGYELRLWRKGLDWTQERAAEELDVSLRSYKRYEKMPDEAVSRVTELATRLLSLRQMLPEMNLSERESILIRLKTTLNSVND